MPKFIVRRTDHYSNTVEAESLEALRTILDGDTDLVEFKTVDEALDWDESEYDVEPEEEDGP